MDKIIDSQIKQAVFILREMVNRYDYEALRQLEVSLKDVLAEIDGKEYRLYQEKQS